MALWFIPDILHSQSYYSLIVVCTAGLELSVLWTGIRCYRINRADIPKKIFLDGITVPSKLNFRFKLCSVLKQKLQVDCILTLF